MISATYQARLLAVLATGAALVTTSAACGDEGTAAAGGQGGSPPTGCTPTSCADPLLPFCNVDTGACEAPPPGGAIGFGDGSVGSVAFVPIYEPTFDREATDLAFNPFRPGELWVVHREFEDDGPCTENVTTACASLEGRVSILTGIGTPDFAAKVRKDPNAWHFMRRPPSIAFGPNDTFATCGEHRTGNFTDDPTKFIGPALWSSDPDVFAKQPVGGNGSHLDMLHSTPECTGIAHESENIYWVVNGDDGSLDRYDFHEDHGPGQDDHSDGETWRYAAGSFVRVPGIPGHLEFEPATGTVLVADTGNARIARFDPAGATEGGPIQSYEPIVTAVEMDGGTVTDVVPAGFLISPSGLALADGVFYVSDNATSLLHAFTLDGTLIRSLDTGLPPGSLAGIALSPEGVLFFVELPTSKVFAIDPTP